MPALVKPATAPARVCATTPASSGRTGGIERLTGHEARLLAAQKADHAGDVLRPTGAPQRGAFRGGLLERIVVGAGAFGDRAGHARLDEAGRDRIDVDVEGAELDGEGARQSLDPRF